MNKVVLYSNDCPKCKVLEKKLIDHNIRYDKVTDVNVMISLGIVSAPILEINGVRMSFKEANIWINNNKGEV